MNLACSRNRGAPSRRRLCDKSGHAEPDSTQSTGATRVIANADDLGLSAEIDDAIFRLANMGAITSASLLAVGDDFERAAEWASRQSNISIGVHLCLTDDQKSLTDAVGLVGADSRFGRLRDVAARAILGRIDRKSVREEWLAQIARIRSSGIEPTHLDSHQHVHVLPCLSDVIVEIARETGLAVRHTSGPFGFSWRSCKGCGAYWMCMATPGMWKSAALRVLGARLGRTLRLQGIPTISAYVSPSSLCRAFRSALSADAYEMIARLAASNTGLVEWVVHPGPAGGDPREPAWMARVRERECALLEADALRGALSRVNAMTVTYADCLSNSKGCCR